MPAGRPRREKLCATCGENDRTKFKHGHYEICAKCHNKLIARPAARAPQASRPNRQMTPEEKALQIASMTEEIKKNNLARREAYYGTQTKP